MPALVIFSRIVQAVRCQLIASERAVFEIDLAAEPLHFTDEPQMAERVVFDVPEEPRHGGRRSQQYQSLVEGRNRSFKQLEHKNPLFPSAGQTFANAGPSKARTALDITEILEVMKFGFELTDLTISAAGGTACLHEPRAT